MAAPRPISSTLLRNAFVLQARSAKAGFFKDRRAPRGGSRNWARQWLDEWLDEPEPSLEQNEPASSP